jgi:hypothetical protein
VGKIIVKQCDKEYTKARHRWLMPIILAAWEAEIRKFTI